MSLLSRSLLLREAALSGSGVRVHDQAAIDPYRASLGFARAASARGTQIFERSRVRRIRQGRRKVELHTAGATVSASAVVIATGQPTGDFKALRRHFKLRDSYAVVTPPLRAAVRRTLGPPSLILRDTSDHWLRWTPDDRVLFSGAARPTVSSRARGKTLVQRTGQLMYELSLLYPTISGTQPEYGWDIIHAHTVDGVPYFGPHRNYPRHLFALGSGPGGLGLSYLAARLMLRSHQGRPDKGDELFGFTRGKA